MAVGDIGVVVGNDEAPGTEDGAVISKLEAEGYTVTPIDDSDDEVTTVDCIVIPGWSINLGQIAGKYLNSNIPIVYGSNTVAKNAGMSNTSGSTASQNGINVQQTHDALGALGTGAVTLWTGGFAMGHLTEADLAGGTVLLGYTDLNGTPGVGVGCAVMDAGGALDGGGTANARRAFCSSFINGSRYTAACDQLLLDMVAWAMAGGGGPVTEVSDLLAAAGAAGMLSAQKVATPTLHSAAGAGAQMSATRIAVVSLHAAAGVSGAADATKIARTALVARAGAAAQASLTTTRFSDLHAAAGASVQFPAGGETSDLLAAIGASAQIGATKIATVTLHAAAGVSGLAYTTRPSATGWSSGAYQFVGVDVRSISLLAAAGVSGHFGASPTRITDLLAAGGAAGQFSAQTIRSADLYAAFGASGWMRAGRMASTTLFAAAGAHAMMDAGVGVPATAADLEPDNVWTVVPGQRAWAVVGPREWTATAARAWTAK